MLTSTVPIAGLPRAAYLRVFDEEVSVDDPIGVHTDESLAVMLQRLTALYSMRCHKGCFIISINSIMDIYPAEIGYESALGQGQVRVQFTAYTLQYEIGDVVVGAEVVNKTGVFVHAKLAIAGVTRLFINVRDSPYTDSIAVGQSIIVRLKRLAYPYGNDKIVANGELYMPSPTNRVYDTGGSEYTVTTEAEAFVEQMNALRAQLAASPDWQRMRDVLFPWKTASPNMPAGGKLTDLATIATHDGNLPPYICRDSRISADAKSTRVLCYNEPIFPGDYELVQGISAESVIIAILTDEIAYLKLLLDCVDAYAGGAFDMHKNIWTVMASAKV